MQPSKWVKIWAVSSFVLLISGFVAYKVGAIETILHMSRGDNYIQTSKPKKDEKVLIPSSKSGMAINKSVSPEKIIPLFVGSKSAPVFEKSESKSNQKLKNSEFQKESIKQVETKENIELMGDSKSSDVFEKGQQEQSEPVIEYVTIKPVIMPKKKVSKKPIPNNSSIK